MLYINNITDDAQQQMTLTGISGFSIQMGLRFMPRIQQWMISINDGNFSVNNVAALTSLNLLRQWRNIIPYGISCVTTGGLDPYQLTDFQNQVATLYLLDQTDVNTIESEWFS